MTLARHVIQAAPKWALTRSEIIGVDRQWVVNVLGSAWEG